MKGPRTDLVDALRKADRKSSRDGLVVFCLVHLEQVAGEEYG